MALISAIAGLKLSFRFAFPVITNDLSTKSDLEEAD
jgi:hypothetical protein